MGRRRLAALGAHLRRPPPSPAAAGASAELDAALEEVFGDFGEATPGCSVGVIRDGEVVAARGFGMAQLEHGAAIGPDTIFHVASVSKQFTAFAVTLLAHERPEVLGLDDPVAKHLPWLRPELAHLTVRQLMHHTSGMRDQWDLLSLAGHRMDDVLTIGTILDLLGRQRELNFPAGSEHMYCNSGYTLMAQVVEAVSGVTFPAFCQQRIFGPLGMSLTHAHDDHELIVPGRAYLLRQTFLLTLSPLRSTDLFCGAGTRTSRRGRRSRSRCCPSPTAAPPPSSPRPTTCSSG